MPIPTDRALVANGLCKRLPKCDAYVLNRVVTVNVEVSPGLHLQVNEAVPGDLIEHVVQKGQASIELTLTGSIQPDRHLDLGLCGMPRHLCLSHVCNDTVAR